MEIGTIDMPEEPPRQKLKEKAYKKEKDSSSKEKKSKDKQEKRDNNGRRDQGRKPARPRVLLRRGN